MRIVDAIIEVLKEKGSPTYKESYEEIVKKIFMSLEQSSPNLLLMQN